MDDVKAGTGFASRQVDKVATGDSAELEHKTRRAHNFESWELSLPQIKVKNPLSLIHNALSHLGSMNPLPKPVTAKNTIWLFDNTAFRSPLTGAWQAELVVSYWEQNTGVDVAKAVADISEKVGLGKGDAAELIIAERLQPFVQEITPGMEVQVTLDTSNLTGQSKDIVLGPGGSNAISSDVRNVPESQEDGLVTHTTARVPDGANGILKKKMIYAEPEGWAVISDIDDTIKLTQTSSPVGILRSTFVSPPTAITGMPELYAFIHSTLGPAAPFFYLSASPYNLYSFLRQFREEFYPHGTIILRDASWMNLSGLLSNLTLGTQAYKVDRIKKINTWLPKRKFICIGDSTQADPETYGEIYRTFPGFVRLIMIRKVTDIASVGLAEKNEPQRFEKAFHDVPTDVWHVFEDPAECQAWVSQVVGADSQDATDS